MAMEMATMIRLSLMFILDEIENKNENENMSLNMQKMPFSFLYLLCFMSFSLVMINIQHIFDSSDESCSFISWGQYSF